MRISLPVVDIGDVASSHLCTGCGCCAAVAPESYEMVDEAPGRRPRVIGPESEDAFAACPGHALRHEPPMSERSEVLDSLSTSWGPVRAIWEGWAADDAIRFAGSSGGAATAIALHAIERGGLGGVLHTGSRADAPWLNESVVSRNRGELLERTGSRYAPASPCEGLSMLETPGVFIGKPCDAAAVAALRARNHPLASNVDLSIAFCCAGTPSTTGTLELLRSVGVEDPETIESLRYRGRGWPGHWTVRWQDGGETREASMTYADSWGFLQRYRQWRCYICPDHTGEFADVAVGDPWYREVQEGESGSSLVIARTARGEEAIRQAIAEGYLVASEITPDHLPRSQMNLLTTRRRLFGQLFALRLARCAVPRFDGFSLRRNWLAFGWRDRVNSILSTLKRVGTKNLRRVERRESSHDRS